MTRGNFLLWNRLHIVLRGFVMIVIITGLVGCAQSTPAPPIACTPSPNVNIYRTAPQSLVEKIIQHVGTLIIPTPAAQGGADPASSFVELPTDAAQLGLQISEARYAAFQYLVDQTKRWSDSETIKLDDTNEAQIIVTFISPELIQAVFLNDFLKSGFIISDFYVQLQNALNSIAARDELLFLITVTSTNNNGINSISHVIDIPLGEMALNNAANLVSIPGHDDHNLDQPINSSFEPVFGYVAYPVGVLKSDGCNLTLDPKYNTNIVITVPDIKIDNATSRQYTWTIPYKPLIDWNNNQSQPTFIGTSVFDPIQMSPSPKPPFPIANQMFPNGSSPDIYWQDFARYVWNLVTLGNY
jgi:hypothetical protein